MSQYLLSVHVSESDYETPPESMQDTYAAVDRFNTELQSSGAWVFAGGLHAPSTATVVDATKTDVAVTDGPYAETKEHLGGFWVIDAANLDAAMEWAKRGIGGVWRPCRGAPVPGRTG